MSKKRFTVIICIMLCIHVFFMSVVYAADINGKNISSQGACVIDFDTGKILYKHNGDIPRVPASMTKLMTVYCVYDAIRNEKIGLNTTVPVSRNVYELSRNTEYQGVPLNYNTIYTVNEMLDVVITYSACAPAVALAELVSGSEAEFVELMNNTAKRMHIDATYYDCFGIAENKITPTAMVKLARNLIKEFPDIISRTSKRSINFHGETLYSTNKLFTSHYYEGADGLKTGTTSASGYCFCGTAKRNGRRIIAVTMASASSNQRFEDMIILLDYGFFVSPDTIPTPALYHTDIKTYVNGNEVPTYNYKDSEISQAVIIAENLIDCGFDVYYEADSNTLTLTYSKKKNIKPISAEKEIPGTKAFDVFEKFENNKTQVIFTDGDTKKTIENVYNLNGYMAISIDELGSIYGYLWDQEKRSAYITADKVKIEDAVYFTDITTDINSCEVPTFMYKGKDSSYAVIAADDLRTYGFNIEYDEKNMTLTIDYAPDKQKLPIPIDFYKNKNGQKAYDLYKSDTNVTVNIGNCNYNMKNVHSSNGYIFVSIDEFAEFASFKWNNELRHADIEIQP